MSKRSGITIGILLILLGLYFLARHFFPSLLPEPSWPWFLIGLGAIFILSAIISRSGGLAVPGAILCGLGGIFYYQNLLADFTSWKYMWALIPGFVGVGIVLSGIIDGHGRSAWGGGLILIVISLALFFVFGGTFGLSQQFVDYWPVVLIAIGLIIILSNLFRKKH